MCASQLARVEPSIDDPPQDDRHRKAKQQSVCDGERLRIERKKPRKICHDRESDHQGEPQNGPL